MSSLEKKMHLIDMSSLSINFKAQSGVSHIDREDKYFDDNIGADLFSKLLRKLY